MNIVEIVSTFGFPIAACLGMAWYVKYITDESRKEVKELNETHSNEMMAFKDEIKEALNNNTMALNRLCDNLIKRGE